MNRHLKRGFLGGAKPPKSGVSKGDVFPFGTLVVVLAVRSPALWAGSFTCRRSFLYSYLSVLFLNHRTFFVFQKAKANM